MATLFIGEMMFEVPMVNGKVIADSDVDTVDGDVEFVTIVQSIQYTMELEDGEFLCDIGEDFITGRNQTGMNPAKRKYDSYYVDTMHEEKVVVLDNAKINVVMTKREIDELVDVLGVSVMQQGNPVICEIYERLTNKIN